MEPAAFKECIRKLNLVKAAAEEKGLGPEALASLDFVASKLAEDANRQETKKEPVKKAVAKTKEWKPSFTLTDINQAMGNFDRFIKKLKEKKKPSDKSG